MRNIKKKTPIGMIAIMALIAWVAFCGSAIADSVSGSAGTNKYFLKPGSTSKGDLAMDGENTWEIIVTGIDGSGVAGNEVYQTFVQESVAWNNFPIQVHHTHSDGTVWLLQSNEFWTVKSSHGFNEVPLQAPLTFAMCLLKTPMAHGILSHTTVSRLRLLAFREMVVLAHQTSGIFSMMDHGILLIRLTS